MPCARDRYIDVSRAPDRNSFQLARGGCGLAELSRSGGALFLSFRPSGQFAPLAGSEVVQPDSPRHQDCPRQTCRAHLV
jgi:hypothetical protein